MLPPPSSAWLAPTLSAPAKCALQAALQAAQEIPNQGSREMNVDSIKEALQQ
jgi:hypothetical protein